MWNLCLSFKKIIVYYNLFFLVKFSDVVYGNLVVRVLNCLYVCFFSDFNLLLVIISNCYILRIDSVFKGYICLVIFGLLL